MPWVRNLRRFVDTGAGLGSEALMAVDFGGDSLGKKMVISEEKPEEGSISSRVQRLAKYRFLKKQSELLLNADDLDAMWVCLRENCVIDDATGAEKVRFLFDVFYTTSASFVLGSMAHC
ncbi:putative serine/threonine-protein phosphatase 2A regulatory subunit B'' subunit TON2 [Zea mays]|uniref:Putative serine/threonine-protein phosphatase 2A regulatory subunit B'' subunit TON2 n=1 Tax=Zea mays TaxID=4577 RepID=A0A3L6FEM3_MAIZE|nr:putative serine/threonine-protein phosphatase 2A regulatory subunit B'' subunit TON2 [Zea mays]